jgi:hypothetical protein
MAKLQAKTSFDGMTLEALDRSDAGWVKVVACFSGLGCRVVHPIKEYSR